MLSGRKIPLFDIRKRLMKEHEELGIVRDHSDSSYESMALDEARRRLNEIGELSQQDMDKSLA